MRIVTLRHRDSRGRTDYKIYETIDRLHEDRPEIAYHIATGSYGKFFKFLLLF